MPTGTTIEQATHLNGIMRPLSAASKRSQSISSVSSVSYENPRGRSGRFAGFAYAAALSGGFLDEHAAFTVLKTRIVSSQQRLISPFRLSLRQVHRPGRSGVSFQVSRGDEFRISEALPLPQAGAILAHHIYAIGVAVLQAGQMQHSVCHSSIVA